MLSHSLDPAFIQALNASSTFIFPTETIYGIGCSAWCEDAIARVFQIKGRPPQQPPPLLVADHAQLTTLVHALSPVATELVAAYWPGSLTLILPARKEVPDAVCGFDATQQIRTVGVRHTAHPLAAALCYAVGAPVVATSANFSGASGAAAAPRSLQDIPETFRQLVNLVLDGGTVGGLPSTVVDCVANEPRVLRSGAVDLTGHPLFAER